MLEAMNRRGRFARREDDMNTVSRPIRACAAAVTLGLVAAGIVAATVSAGTAPAGFTDQQWNALRLRSEALNQKYHLGASRSVPDREQAVRALRLRSEALNRKYQLGQFAIARPARPSGGFDWGAAGIGAAATLGAVFAAVGIAAGTRRHRGGHDGPVVSRTS